jgi:glycosyltransferase involved in cell wall biosynthesis
MKILFCNKYNHPFSGTEVYLFELMELLRAHGNEVALFSMDDPQGEATDYDKYFVSPIDFKGESGPFRKIKMAAHAIYSIEARNKIRAMIRDFRPDVAHVRNIYHHLSPSILWELKALRVPVLYHLNDFKLLCPSYNLVASGDACEACRNGSFWHALASRCYPGFGARSTLVAEAYLHRWLGTYRECVDLFLAPSHFVRSRFAEHGWDLSRFRVLPHFQRVAPVSARKPVVGAPLLYFGRLSAEKGVDDLLCAMSALPELRLVIAGDGPQRGELELLAGKLRLRNVKFVGKVAAVERDALIAQSLFTVMPSHAYETFGKTILESYAQARPVIASDRGSRRELVRHGQTGLLYRCGDISDLARSIEELAGNPEMLEGMGTAAQNLVRQRYTPEQHYEQLIALYHTLDSQRLSGAPQIVLRQPKPMLLPFRPRRGFVTEGKPRLRIAFIGGRGVISKYSGIETYYEEVGKRLARAGHEVTIYCRTHFTPDSSQHNGMHLVRFPTIRSKHLDTLVHTFLSTMHSLTQRYDVVHYHALGPALFSLIPRLFGTKTAVTVQGLDWQRKKWSRFAIAVLRMGEKASARFPNLTMVVSRVLQERYRKVHGIESARIPNGGMMRDRATPHKILEWGLTPGQYVLFLGRFSPEKQCHVLVQAFESIDTDVKLVLAGASSYCDEYGRELRTHASDRIRILDWVSGETLDELLTNAMLFVLPSDMEGLSLALLDAMGAGLCVLTSDVPENREVVEGAGFTFRCGDVANLTERLRVLLANPTIREAAGKLARKRIEELYQWDSIASQIEQAYLEMLGWNIDSPVPGRPAASTEEHERERQAV